MFRISSFAEAKIKFKINKQNATSLIQRSTTQAVDFSQIVVQLLFNRDCTLRHSIAFSAYEQNLDMETSCITCFVILTYRSCTRTLVILKYQLCILCK